MVNTFLFLPLYASAIPRWLLAWSQRINSFILIFFPVEQELQQNPLATGLMCLKYPWSLLYNKNVISCVSLQEHMCFKWRQQMLMIPLMETALEWFTAFFRGNHISPSIPRQVNSLSATVEDLSFGFFDSCRQYQWTNMDLVDMAKIQKSNLPHDSVLSID